MAAAVDALKACALGVQGFAQPIVGAPKLIDGVHVRWSFSQTRGFPWHGYWLLRRLSSTAAGGAGGAWVPAGSANGAQGSGGGFGDTDGTAMGEGPGDGADSQRPRPGESTDDFDEVNAATTLTKQVIQAMPPWQRRALANASKAPPPVGGAAGVITGATGPIAWALMGGGGWSVVGAGPLALPVTHPDYPPTLGKAQVGWQADGAAAKARIAYGSPDVHLQTNPGESAPPFAALHAALVALVEGGPAAAPMAERLMPAELAADGADADNPMGLPAQPWLHWLALAALHPEVAQLLGIAAVDISAQSNIAYDYLVIADHDGSVASAGGALPWLQTSPLPKAHGPEVTLVEGVAAKPCPALAAPPGVAAYALPGGRMPSPTQPGVMLDATRQIGLRWQVQTPTPAPGGGQLWPGPLLLYGVWRAELGPLAKVPSSAPAESQWLPLQGGGVGQAGALPTPTLAANEGPYTAQKKAGKAGKGSKGGKSVAPGWPAMRLQLVDVVADDGWYAYAVAARDVFGRYSPRGAPIPWRTFQQPPGADARWYDALATGGDGVLNTYAVAARDMTPPPPPAGLRVALQDADDAYSVAAWARAIAAGKGEVGGQAIDAATAAQIKGGPFWAWRASLAETAQADVSAQVSWRWGYSQVQQGPLVSRFDVVLRRADGSEVEVCRVGYDGKVLQGAGGFAVAMRFEPHRHRDGAAFAAKAVAAKVDGGGGVVLTLHDGNVPAAAIRPELDFVQLVNGAGQVANALVAGVVGVAPLMLRLAAGAALPPGPYVGCEIGEPLRCYEGFVPVLAALELGAADSEARCELVVRSVVDGGIERVSKDVGQRLIRVRRVWPADAPLPKLVVVSDRAAGPDADGLCAYTVHWEVPPGAERFDVVLSVATEAELLLAEARLQPRSSTDWIGKDGMLQPKLTAAIAEGLVSWPSMAPSERFALLTAVGVRLQAMADAAAEVVVAVPSAPGAFVPLVKARAAVAAARVKLVQVADKAALFSSLRGWDTAIARAELGWAEGSWSAGSGVGVAVASYLDGGEHAEVGRLGWMLAVAVLQGDAGGWRRVAEVPCGVGFAAAVDRRGLSDPVGYVAQGDRRSWTVEGLAASDRPSIAVLWWCAVDGGGELRATRVAVVGVAGDLRLAPAPRVVAVFQGRLAADGVSRVVDATMVTIQWLQPVTYSPASCDVSSSRLGGVDQLLISEVVDEAGIEWHLATRTLGFSSEAVANAVAKSRIQVSRREHAC